MIRRDQPQALGRQFWVLISQVDHAHLAAQLAEHWGSGPFAPLAPREPLVQAIYHHDDGWSEWEARPKVDLASGKPLAFNELALDESLAIWRRSIAAVRRLGPLEGYVVAGHFRALLERFDSWRRAGDGERRLAEDFLAEYGRQMTSWLQDWQPGDQLSSPGCTLSRDHAANLGLAQLQLFDALSLWLCCTGPNKPHSANPPGGPVLMLNPLDKSEIRISPWPFDVESLDLGVSGRRVEMRHYASPDDLAAALTVPCTVSWRLVR